MTLKMFGSLAVLSLTAATVIVIPAAPVGSSTTTAWSAPISGKLTVVRPFIPPPKPWQSGHRGVDLRARVDMVVRAPGPGLVVYAGPLAGRSVISVEHGPGIRTTYEPVSATVTVGQRVRTGTPLGRVAQSKVHRNRLHWGLKVRGQYVNPLRLLRHRSLLKPNTSAQ